MQTTAYAVVTGATSPIGMAIAEQLSPIRRLILHGRNREKLAGLRDACSNRSQHLLWEQDLSLTEGIASSLGSLLGEREISVNAFVHCAATLQLGAFRLMSPRVELELFSVNVLSAMEIVRILRSQKYNGTSLTNVVLISSGASLFGEKGNASYTATKGALDSFMKSLAIELSPSGRANSILPGMVEGGMSDQSQRDPSYAEVIKANYPLGLGRPSDVGSAVDFLLSDKSRWITGQQILVDGGFSAHCNHVI
jgi:NAD(P)-dependent dehydrogenase (short-subunit alcohol dehydrogenase family)